MDTTGFAWLLVVVVRTSSTLADRPSPPAPPFPLYLSGISLKTQELYALVFLTRYVDLLFTNPLRSPLTTYNTVMKILFISSSLYIVHQMRTRYVHTYNAAADAFRVPFLVGPAAVAALLFHLKNTVVEVVWAFSIFLEAVAIMPQLFLLQKTGEVENITSHYIAALGAYRALYAVNWVWRAFWEPGYRQWLAWTAGVVQTVLYADFFYHYIKRYVWDALARDGRGCRAHVWPGRTAGLPCGWPWCRLGDLVQTALCSRLAGTQPLDGG